MKTRRLRTLTLSMYSLTIRSIARRLLMSSIRGITLIVFGLKEPTQSFTTIDPSSLSPSAPDMAWR